MLTRIFRHHLSILTILVVLGLALLASGCKQKAAWEDPGPAAIFEGFLMDWFRGDKEAAFNSLAEDDRKALSAPLQKLDASLGDGQRPGPADMLVVGRVNNPYDFKSIKLKKPMEKEPGAGERVELELNFHDGQQGAAWMVWDGERWLVDLPIEAARTGEEPREQPLDKNTPQDDDLADGENLAEDVVSDDDEMDTDTLQTEPTAQ